MKRKRKGEWSPNGYIFAALRRIWRWSPNRRECLKSVKCIQCEGKTKLFADHIDPVIQPETGFKDWNTYIDRLFNGKLQPLCETCHKAKTKAEGKVRRLRAKARKSL